LADEKGALPPSPSDRLPRGIFPKKKPGSEASVRKLVKITGERGRWTAEVEGKRLAVIHNTWRVGQTGYEDPMEGIDRNGKRFREYAEALRHHDFVVMQRDVGGGDLSRDGYIGVFSFDNLDLTEGAPVRLRLLDRVADPKR